MKVYQQGNALVLRIPKAVAEELNVDAGSEFRCAFDGKSIVLERDNPQNAYSWQAARYAADELERVNERRPGTPSLDELLEARELGYTVSWVFASQNGVDHTFSVDPALMYDDLEFEAEVPEPPPEVTSPPAEQEPIVVRPAAPPPETGHHYIAGPRYLHTFICSAMCGAGAWGMESDEETIPPPVCPHCDRRSEFQSTTDRSRYAPLDAE